MVYPVLVPTTGNEYPNHINAKIRLKEILKTAGYKDIQFEVQQPTVMLKGLGERRYTADIQATKKRKKYIFEIDGMRGHSSRRNRAKDKTRDGALLKLKRRTIRLPTWWLVGEGKLSDREILDEIEWQESIIQNSLGVQDVEIKNQKVLSDVLNVEQV